MNKTGIPGSNGKNLAGGVPIVLACVFLLPRIAGAPLVSILDCTWVESESTVIVGDMESRAQASAAAVNEARHTAMLDFLGVEVRSTAMVYQVDDQPDSQSIVETLLKDTRLGRILKEQIVESGYQDRGDCVDCSFHVKLRACIAPVAANFDKDFQIELTMSRSRFVEGDEAKMSVTATRNCYLYVYEIDDDWQTTLIVPNAYESEVELTGGVAWEYPNAAMKKQNLRWSPQIGDKRPAVSARTLRAIGSRTPLPSAMIDPSDGGYLGVLRRINATNIAWAEDAQAFTLYRGEQASPPAIASTGIPPDTPRVPLTPKVPPKLSAQVVFTEPSGDSVLDAFEKGNLQVTVFNAGRGPASAVQTRFSLETPVPGLLLPDPLELGAVMPSKTATVEIPFSATGSVASGKARVKMEITEGSGFDAEPILIEFQTRAFQPPVLEISKISLGGPGFPKAGEEARVLVLVKNAGLGPAGGVSAAFNIESSNLFPTGESIFFLGALNPGQSKTVEFKFVVNNRFKEPVLPVSITLAESRGRYGIEDRALNLAWTQSPASAMRVVAIQGREPARAAQDLEPEDIDQPPQTNNPIDPEAYAIVVGIEKYQQIGIPPVEYANRDAEAVKNYLTQAMGFDPANVVLLQNEAATKTTLDKYLGPWLRNHASKKSRVFIYFAGHGAPNPETGEGFLVPYDGDPNYTEVTALPIKALYETLAKLPAANVTVALDACFSGRGQRSLIAKGTRAFANVVKFPAAIGPNTVVLTATGGGQVSTFYPDGRHGLFTYFLLKGLQGGADADKNGMITTKELFSYLKPTVEREARKQNIEQIPTLSPAPEALGERGQRVWIRRNDR